MGSYFDVVITRCGFLRLNLFKDEMIVEIIKGHVKLIMELLVSAEKEPLK